MEATCFLSDHTWASSCFVCVSTKAPLRGAGTDVDVGAFQGGSLSPGSHSPEFHKLARWSLLGRCPSAPLGNGLDALMCTHLTSIRLCLCGLGMCRLPQIHTQRCHTHTHPNLSVCCWGFRGVKCLGSSSTPGKGEKTRWAGADRDGTAFPFPHVGAAPGPLEGGTAHREYRSMAAGLWHRPSQDDEGRDPSAVSPWGSPRLMASPAFQANHEHASLFGLARGCPQTYRTGSICGDHPGPCPAALLGCSWRGTTERKSSSRHQDYITAAGINNLLARWENTTLMIN